jgi:hypothetical protein
MSNTPRTDALKFQLRLIAHDHEKGTILQEEVNERVAAELSDIEDMERELSALKATPSDKGGEATDTARLDWLEKNCGDFQLKDGSFPFPDHPNGIRLTIDAAMKNKEGA